MHSAAMIAFALLAACSGSAGSDDKTAPARNDSAGPVVAMPAGAPPLSGQEPMGATPGPCGSVRVADFVGRRYDPAMDAEILARSGASRVHVYDGYVEAADMAGPEDPRRLNLLLNDSGVIILIDCGG